MLNWALWVPESALCKGVGLGHPLPQHADGVLPADALVGQDMRSVEAVVRANVPVLNEQVTCTALSPVRLPSCLPTPANRRAERARRAVWEFVEGLIARRRATDVAAHSDTGGGSDLLGILLTAQNPDTGGRLDDIALRDQASSSCSPAMIRSIGAVRV